MNFLITELILLFWEYFGGIYFLYSQEMQPHTEAPNFSVYHVCWSIMSANFEIIQENSKCREQTWQLLSEEWGLNRNGLFYVRIYYLFKSFLKMLYIAFSKMIHARLHILPNSQRKVHLFFFFYIFSVKSAYVIVIIQWGEGKETGISSFN